jgi:Protein of unknown function (DUF2905)
MLGSMGRWLMLIGGGLLVMGLLIVLLSKLPWAGRLPGDVTIQRDNVTIYAPFGTMILLSVVLTLILNLLIRLRR